MENKIKKIVLAYSGGLDTSVILKWLQNEYSCEVIAYTADLGQQGEIDSAKSRAKKLGCNGVHKMGQLWMPCAHHITND